MSKIVSGVVLLVLLIGSIGWAQTSYVISLHGNMNSSSPYFANNSTSYNFFPYISVTKDGSASNAFVTFSSPSGAFIGYANNPSTVTGQSNNEPSTAAIVSNTNGQWTMQIEDGSDTFNYTMNVSLTLPFTDLPVLSSPELVNGNDFPSTFHFGVNGGSATYPGADTRVRGQLFATDFSANYANDLLSPGASSWTPSADLSGVSQVLAFLRTTNEAVDSTALSITNIEAVPGVAVPSVSFDATTLLYSSDASATLNVPEPASIGCAAICSLALLRRRRIT